VTNAAPVLYEDAGGLLHSGQVILYDLIYIFCVLYKKKFSFIGLSETFKTLINTKDKNF